MITIQCRRCHTELELEESTPHDAPLKCPVCEQHFCLADITKRCPFCGEEINPKAIKCRFCGEMLENYEKRVSSPQEEVDILPEEPLSEPVSRASIRKPPRPTLRINTSHQTKQNISDSPKNAHPSSSNLIKLYGPNDMGIGGAILCTPVFSAYCIMKNWETLGRPDYARTSKIWMICFLVLYLVSLFIPSIGIGFFMCVFFYAFDCRKQTKYLTLNSINWKAKNWVLSALIGIILTVVYFIALISLHAVMYGK